MSVHQPQDFEIPKPVKFKVITRTSRLLKWKDQELGFVLQGIWRGLAPAKGEFEPLGIVEVADGEEVLIPRPTSLAPELDRIPIGTAIEITYLGKIKGPRSQAAYHRFVVAIDENVEVPDRIDEMPEEAR